MIHLALQTEFSFKKCFMHMKDIHKYVVDGYVGIADINSTFGHVFLAQEAKKHDFKPIFGVRLHVLPNDSIQRVCNTSWIFIAKNDNGLRELYELVEKAYDNFYYIPKLTYSDINRISINVVIIAPCIIEGVKRDYVAKGQGYENIRNDRDPQIAMDNNNFPLREDREVYELLAGSRKHGNGYSHMFQSCTYPQHIMDDLEWRLTYDDGSDVIYNTHNLARSCNAKIPIADMVKWTGDHWIYDACLQKKDKVENWTQEYYDRLEYEVNLIIEKDYVDYFMIVSDLIKHCKKTMLVGPARGSSAGSLVCYLLDITEVDPIEHGLIFERFIDINRFDLPDIDIDFPDTKRDSAIGYLKHKYGRDKVMCLANINRLKAKSAIGEFAKGLGIPPFETDGVKDAIIERSSGDARAAMCIADTFETTLPGKDFIEKYPKMALVSEIEGHASHAGKHAAGILVSTLPLSNYGSLNNRDGIIMMDKKQAEFLNLLKIDCLGLRTLSILEGVATQLGVPLKAFYKLPLDDPPTYELFNSMRLSGIFQFEGQALQIVVKQMGVKDFNDITAITALARPGALNSGGTARYVKYANGDDIPTFFGDTHRKITCDTFGIVVYQEQMMEIAREIGGLSWAEVSQLRRAASKSMGDEFFGKYKSQFIKGAIANGYEEEIAERLWSDISASGSWSFNKSHAVSYGLISYWTAWCKANHPMEFAVASLNNAGNPDNAVKLLRDLVRNDGLKYKAIDPDTSEMEWSVQDGILVGGLTNIKMIGEAKAKKILKAREGKAKLTPALYKALNNPETVFDVIFPADHYWGHLYKEPSKHQLSEQPVFIDTVEDEGEYVFIGCLIDRNVRDLNEHIFLTKRNNEIIEGDSLFLNFKLEDDTDMISCTISRWKYEAIGRVIAETGKIGKDWYLVKGHIKGEWRRIHVTEIINLNQYFKVKIK